ncbi:MAG: hypothetical protein ACP5M1_00310 [Acidiphilium sp.]
MTAQQSVLLGPVTLRGFEVPEQIVFGGGQRVAVHELIGGGRVIDSLGAAAEAIMFGGIFSGPDAALRMQSLDAARAAGLVLPLSWGDFAYSVIITELSASYQKSWWVPYSLRLAVVEDPVAVIASIAVQAGLDLASAGGFAQTAGVSLASTSVSSPISFSAPLAGLSSAIGLAGNQVGSATATLAGTMVVPAGITALSEAAGACAVQANALAAQAYLRRAAANIAGAGA